MRTTSRPRRAIVTAAALSVVLAGCAQDRDPDTDPASDDTVAEQDDDGDEDPAGTPGVGENGSAEDESLEGEANEEDVEFVQGMVPHHQGAIEMAELVEARTERQELVDLAEEIVAVQDAEITVLHDMLSRMGSEEMPLDDMAGDHGDMGMMSDADMAELHDLTGEAFDRRFLEGMIEHHQGAIDMSERVLDEGQDEEVAGLAQAVIAAQEAEIDQMRTWLEEWGLA